MIKIRELFHNQKGFTLIELVFVVIILAVLAGVALLNMGDTEDSAKDAKVKADFRAMATAIKVYKVKTGNYPANLTALTTASGSYASPMLDEVPVDPYSATGAIYTSTTDADDGVTITSVGPGGTAITKTYK